MGVEIERKFLVDKNLFKPSVKGELVHQVYLKRNNGRSVRVRIIGTNAFITIKNTITAMVKNEFEYAIPLQDAQEMIEIFKDLPAIKKIRYQQVIDGNEWVVDEFLGENEGLLMAEIELPSTSTSFSKPAWLLKEVTDDFRFHNSSLAALPFKGWTEKP
ncbi:MAG: CYTH domain-containing protein [Bacteroidetes bacterium]|nr:CYTH domain-containing protein [Bacteroidota bacterium]